MSEEHANNINVSDQTGDFGRANYRESDLERVLSEAHASSWQELGRWVALEGDKEWHITPGVLSQ